LQAVIGRYLPLRAAIDACVLYIGAWDLDKQANGEGSKVGVSFGVLLAALAALYPFSIMLSMEMPMQNLLTTWIV